MRVDPSFITEDFMGQTKLSSYDHPIWGVLVLLAFVASAILVFSIFWFLFKPFWLFLWEFREVGLGSLALITAFFIADEKFLDGRRSNR